MGVILPDQTSSPTICNEAAVLLSGGIDSAACAHLLKGQGYSVRGVFIDFGQAAVEQERKAVSELAMALGIEVGTITTRSDAGFGSGELIGRNAFLVLAAIFLARTHRGLLALGIHAGTPYFDCSPLFLSRIKQLAAEHTSGELVVVAPFIDWEKPQIFEYFKQSGLPLAATYSCESGTMPPCGSCASCRDREALGC
jgi:7-cyano-7-deazaguanine synthase